MLLYIKTLPVENKKISYAYQLCLLMTILLVGCSTQRKKMNEVYEFTKINVLSEDKDKNITSFKTDTGKKISIQKNKISPSELQFIHRALAEDKVIFLAYDSQTGLCNFAVPFTEDYVDTVELIESNSLKTFEISLILRPAFLYLSLDHPNLNKLQKILNKAKKDNALVWVGTFSGDSDILDIRLAPAKAKNTAR